MNPPHPAWSPETSPAASPAADAADLVPAPVPDQVLRCLPDLTARQRDLDVLAHARFLELRPGAVALPASGRFACQRLVAAVLTATADPAGAAEVLRRTGAAQAADGVGERDLTVLAAAVLYAVQTAFPSEATRSSTRIWTEYLTWLAGEQHTGYVQAVQAPALTLAETPSVPAPAPPPDVADAVTGAAEEDASEEDSNEEQTDLRAQTGLPVRIDLLADVVLPEEITLPEPVAAAEGTVPHQGTAPPAEHSPLMSLAAMREHPGVLPSVSVLPSQPAGRPGSGRQGPARSLVPWRGRRPRLDDGS